MLITLRIQGLLKHQESPRIEETQVSRFFCRILQGDKISGMKCQKAVYQKTWLRIEDFLHLGKKLLYNHYAQHLCHELQNICSC